MSSCLESTFSTLVVSSFFSASGISCTVSVGSSDFSRYKIHERINATPAATTISSRYPMVQSVVIRNPNTPVIPYALAPTCIIPATRPPAAPPIHPAIKGFTYLKFTPKIAGSVIPRNADNDAGNATERVF